MRIVGFWPVVTCRGGARMSPGFLEPWWRSSRYSQWGRYATCACDSLTDIFWKFSVGTPSPHGDWRAALWSYRLRTMCKFYARRTRFTPVRCTGACWGNVRTESLNAILKIIRRASDRISEKRCYGSPLS